MKFKKYSNGAWTDAPYYIMKNGSWTSTTDVHEMDNGVWYPISSWNGFRSLVRSGTASSLYPIGTELYETWGDNTSNAWIIVDYDNNDYMDPDLTAQGYTHNVILMEKNINQLASFEDKQAFISLTQSIADSAFRVQTPSESGSFYGTYRFTGTEHQYGEGSQASITWTYTSAGPTMISMYMSPYASDAYASYTKANGTTGTLLGKIKGSMSDTDSSYGLMNFYQRCGNDTVGSGSNNYYQSSLRQWINATTAEEWWNPGCVFSRLWSSYNLPGKLYTLNSDMKSVLATPTIPCRTNNMFETGSIGETPFALDTAYTVRDKMFLPSHTELGDTASSPVLGSTWSYFTTDAQTRRVRTYNGTTTSYWLRSPNPSTAHRVRYIGSNGNDYSDAANNSTHGVICACTIQ